MTEQKLVQVIAEEQLPDSFSDLLGSFVETQTEDKPMEFNQYIAHQLGQKYPVLSEDATTAKRTISLELAKKTKESISKIHSSEIYYLCRNHHLDYIDSRDISRDLPKDFSLILPLFAITSDDLWETKATIYGEKNVDLECKISIDDWECKSSFTTFVIPKLNLKYEVSVSAKTPVPPSEVNDAIPEAFGDYYSAVGKAISNLKLKKAPELESPKISVLWVPSADSLKIEAIKPKPTYRDPALVMDCGKNGKYIVGLWDLENGEAVGIEGMVREWSSGSFKGVRRK